jgi:hypothetical protein
VQRFALNVATAEPKLMGRTNLTVSRKLDCVPPHQPSGPSRFAKAKIALLVCNPTLPMASRSHRVMA